MKVFCHSYQGFFNNHKIYIYIYEEKVVRLLKDNV